MPSYPTEQIDIEYHRHETLFQGQAFVLLLNGVELLLLPFPPEKFRRCRMQVVVRLKHRRQENASQTAAGRLAKQTSPLTSLFSRARIAIYLAVARSNGHVEQKP